MGKKLAQDMNQIELTELFEIAIREVDELMPSDIIGSMVMSFTEHGIAHYSASIDPSCAPDALRELADRLERRDVVER